MKKIISVVGARPQFIKAAVISRAISKSNVFVEKIIHTGQHFDKNMSSIFFKEMEIPKPRYHLEINCLTHGAMTGRMIEKIEKVLMNEKPDVVMVYGDTNSTLAGALAAKKLNIRVAHVEAGLRSFNMNMPEEINRILTDRISDVLFCPTDNAVLNLHKEGFQSFNCRIHNVGDVMYDAALYYGAKSSHRSAILDKLDLYDKNYVLCTIHRQENTDDLEKLKSIITALNEINKTLQVILPLHPRTRKIISQNRIFLAFKPIEPVGYFDNVELIKNAQIILTDSGGMQKEAFFFKKYCITLRNETEWTELVENEVNFLAGTSSDKILGYVNMAQKPFPPKQYLYGDGTASEKIIRELLSE